MPRYSLKKLSLTARTAIVCASTIILSLLFCLFASAIAKSSSDPAKNLTVYGEGCFFAAMLFCGFFGAKIATEKRFISGFLPSIVMLLFVITASIAFGGDSFMKELILAVLGAFIAAAGAAIGSTEKKRKRRK